MSKPGTVDADDAELQAQIDALIVAQPGFRALSAAFKRWRSRRKAEAPMPGNLEDLAVRMYRAKRAKLDNARILNGPRSTVSRHGVVLRHLSDPPLSDEESETARQNLSAARIEWRKSSAAFWRLAKRLAEGHA